MENKNIFNEEELNSILKLFMEYFEMMLQKIKDENLELNINISKKEIIDLQEEDIKINEQEENIDKKIFDYDFTDINNEIYNIFENEIEDNNFIEYDEYDEEFYDIHDFSDYFNLVYMIGDFEKDEIKIKICNDKIYLYLKKKDGSFSGFKCIELDYELDLKNGNNIVNFTINNGLLEIKNIKKIYR